MRGGEFTLRVRAEEGVDGIRSLRAWLKRGLRDFGLRCLEVQECNQQRRTTMGIDMRNYASTYVKPDNVRDGPITTRIVNVFESERHGRRCSSSRPARSSRSTMATPTR